MTESIEAVNSPDVQQAEDSTNEVKDEHRCTATKRTLQERLHWWITADLTVGFIVLLVLTGLLWNQAILTHRALRRVEQQRDIALARQWVAVGQLEFDNTPTGPFIGTALGIESMRLDPSWEGNQLLQRGLSRLPHQVSRVQHADE
jgi:tetrahydromethanopterin S-methyltransferase subunit F